jgi:hypothetical protein
MVTLWDARRHSRSRVSRLAVRELAHRHPTGTLQHHHPSSRCSDPSLDATIIDPARSRPSVPTTPTIPAKRHSSTLCLVRVAWWRVSHFQQHFDDGRCQNEHFLQSLRLTGQRHDTQLNSIHALAVWTGCLPTTVCQRTEPLATILTIRDLRMRHHGYVTSAATASSVLH